MPCELCITMFEEIRGDALRVEGHEGAGGDAEGVVGGVHSSERRVAPEATQVAGRKG